MNPLGSNSCDQIDISAEPNISIATMHKEFFPKNTGLTPPGNRILSPSTPSEGYNKLTHDKSIGTNSGIMGRVMPSTIHNELLVDIPRSIKAKSIEISSEIDKLNELFTFREADQVKQFLSGNKTVIEMIFSIYKKIRREFPSEEIFLEAISDLPHSSEKDIVISVSTSLPVDEAIERLDKVEDVRWNKDSIDPYVNICVKLEYQ